MASAQTILICFHDFARGGTERIAIGMAKHWVDAGREVIILAGSLRGGMRALVDPRVQVHALSPAINRGLTSRIGLARAMAPVAAKLAPDVIFLPGNFHLALAVALGKLEPRPVIAAKISNPLVPKGLLSRPIKLLLRRYQHSVDAVAGMNSGLTKELTTLLPEIQATTLFDPINIAASPHIDVRDHRLNILWAGRFEPQKDAWLALKTIAALNALRPARLTLLGDGSQYHKILRAISTLGLADYVAAPGYAPGIDAYLQSADALLITSHYEGGPAVAAEALAHDVPVVSTDCSYFLHDLLVVPEAGRIVRSRSPDDLAAALLDITSAPLGEHGLRRALVAHLEPKARAQAYLDWFDGLVRARSLSKAY